MLRDLVKKRNTKELKNKFKELHAYDLALLYQELNEDDKLYLENLLSSEQLADFISYLDPEDAAEVVADFDLEKQVDVLEFMEPDDAADIILELDEDEQEELLKSIDEDIRELVKYDEDETGASMTNAIVTLSLDMEVKKATKKVIKEAPEVESINTLFVVDDEDNYLGIVPLKSLLKAKSPMYISDIITKSPVVYDKDPIEEAINMVRNYAIYEIPVLKKGTNELLGMLTLDDVIDVAREEAQEDFEKLAALPDTDTDKKPIKTAFHRLPWLIVLLCLSIPIALVTSLFEETIAAVALLMFFQPLVLDTAGNVATQTLAVTLTTLSTNKESIHKNTIKEIITGMINGLLLGIVAFGAAYVFGLISKQMDEPLLLGLVVGLSLWITVFLAPIVAAIIPLILKALKIDPATASGPFITTIIDIGALLIFFGLASIFLL